MSYDIRLRLADGTEVFYWNMTYNLYPMIDAAGMAGVFSEHLYPNAHNALPVLKSGFETLVKNPTRYRIHEPRSGHGTLDNLITTVALLVAAIEQLPSDSLLEIT